jgi:hypothetical protein
VPLEGGEGHDDGARGRPVVELAVDLDDEIRVLEELRVRAGVLVAQGLPLEGLLRDVVLTGAEAAAERERDLDARLQLLRRLVEVAVQRLGAPDRPLNAVRALGQGGSVARLRVLLVARFTWPCNIRDLGFKAGARCVRPADFSNRSVDPRINYASIDRYNTFSRLCWLSNWLSKLWFLPILGLNALREQGFDASRLFFFLSFSFFSFYSPFILLLSFFFHAS